MTGQCQVPIVRSSFEMLPRFRVIQEHSSAAGEVLGLVTATMYGHDTWVGNGWIAYLMADSKFILGRWHRREDLWGFAPENSSVIQILLAEREWTILDSYWGARAELVFDMTRQWQRARFEPENAVRSNRNGAIYLKKVDAFEPVEGEIVERGWDHEHCAICWETLGPGGQPEGYVSEGATWVCERCYDAFVQPRSLEFIPNTL